MDKVNKQIILLILPPVMIFVCIAGLSYIEFKPFPSAAQQQPSGLSIEKVQIISRQPLSVPALENPISVTIPVKQDYPDIPLSKLAPAEQQQQKEMTVSLIVISGGRKMAIINSTVVNEGGIVNQKKVAKIEKNRVLIKDKEGEKWIRIE